MKLSDIKNGNLSAEWAEKGYELPKFDIEAVKAKTHAERVEFCLDIEFFFIYTLIIKNIRSIFLIAYRICCAVNST